MVNKCRLLVVGIFDVHFLPIKTAHFDYYKDYGKLTISHMLIKFTMLSNPDIAYLMVHSVRPNSKLYARLTSNFDSQTAYDNEVES